MLSVQVGAGVVESPDCISASLSTIRGRLMLKVIGMREPVVTIRAFFLCLLEDVA